MKSEFGYRVFILFDDSLIPRQFLSDVDRQELSSSTVAVIRYKSSIVLLSYYHSSIFMIMYNNLAHLSEAA